MYLTITSQGELLVRLDGLPRRLRSALRAKMDEAVEFIYDKVEQNLSGVVLNQKSGALAASVVRGVEEQGNLLIGYVAPEPADEKALTQEFGGRSYYWILPEKARALRFIGRSGQVVFARAVFHPPLPARPYMEPAFREAVERFGPEFEEIIAGAMRE